MRRFFVQKLMSYAEAGKSALVSPASGQQLKIYAVELKNRAGANQDMGVGRLLVAENDYQIGTVSDADTPDYTDQTDAFAAGGPVAVFTTTANDGFLVQARNPFHMIGLTVSQAQTGAPVYALEYFNGTAFTALPMIATPSLTSTGDKLYVFGAPHDWATGGPAGVGVTSGMYAVRIRATTAGGQDVEATAAWVAELLAFQGDIPQNGSFVYSVPYEAAQLLEAEQALIPYFGVPAAGNLVTARYYREG